MPPEYDFLYPLTEGLAAFSKAGKAGYLDSSGAMAIPAAYDDAKPFVAIAP